MPLNKKNIMNYAYNPDPKCPRCDKIISIDENDLWELYDDAGPHELTCPYCDAVFLVTAHSEWSFSTDEQEEQEKESALKSLLACPFCGHRAVVLEIPFGDELERTAWRVGCETSVCRGNARWDQDHRERLIAAAVWNCRER